MELSSTASYELGSRLQNILKIGGTRILADKFVSLHLAAINVARYPFAPLIRPAFSCGIPTAAVDQYRAIVRAVRYVPPPGGPAV